MASCSGYLQQHGCTETATGCHHLLQCHQFSGERQAVELSPAGMLIVACMPGVADAVLPVTSSHEQFITVQPAAPHNLQAA